MTRKQLSHRMPLTFGISLHRLNVFTYISFRNKKESYKTVVLSKSILLHEGMGAVLLKKGNINSRKCKIRVKIWQRWRKIYKKWEIFLTLFEKCTHLSGTIAPKKCLGSLISHQSKTMDHYLGLFYYKF